MENKPIKNKERNDDPFISFVVVARNDNYAGNFLNRIGSFLKTTELLARKNNLSAEIIVVEYNPPPNKKRLYEEIALPDTNTIPIRFLEVPGSFHKKYENSDKNPLFEYIGKNIGVYRAYGEYIVAMNPDVILSNKLVEFLSKKELRNNTFYRANRHDLSVYEIDKNLDVEKILNLCYKKTAKILYAGGTVYTSYSSWLYRFIHGRTLRSFMFCPLFNYFTAPKKKMKDRLHENASGDFTLMHKDMWDKSGGYDESPLGSALLDGYLLYVLYCLGYEQKILDYPIYHIEHQYAKGSRPIASHKQYIKDTKEMLKTKKPYKSINKNWGFPSMKFKETLF